MKRYAFVVGLISLGLAACGGKQKVADEPPPPKPVQIDGHERLGEEVTPKKYTLDLTIDPAKDTFSGKAVIDVEVAATTHVIYLHGEELTVKSAKFVRRDESFPAEARAGENGGLALVFAPDLAAGPGKIEIEYEAPLDEVPTGLYKVKESTGSYAFTQFEPLEARQAFPSFDEPRFKTPYQVTMRVPTGQLALTNTPETSRKTEGEWDVFEFSESKPLPTYLVAFAVGDFDVVEAPADAIPNVPLRLIATKGKGALGQWMLDKTPILLQQLSEYFGAPYPFQKLDIVAVPNFSAGAMENVGLVTFRETLLLIDPETASVSERRSAMSVMTHELAHMWFGNYVTLPWWDELWLNEAFATWMAHRVITNILPELEGDVDAIVGARWIMSADSKTQSRSIRQPIAHGGDVYNAFDGITYGKGAAVLRMFEAWVAPDSFKAAVRNYMKANAYGTGTTTELLAELDKAAQKPVGEAMSTFLDQPGAPLLNMSLNCEGGVKLSVAQSRYLPAQSQAPKTGPWKVPFCVAYPEGSETKTFCELLDTEQKDFDLATNKCPAWVYPNAGQIGYYRWNLPAEDYAKLLDRRALRKFDDATKVEIFANTQALADAEAVTAEQWFDTVEAMADEKHRVIVRQVVGALYQVEPLVKDEALRKKFVRLAAKVLKPHMRRVGYTPKDREDVDVALLRPTLVSAAAFLADDDRARKAAQEATKQFLENAKSVRSDMVKTALPISAWSGDASLWLSYQMSLSSPPTPAARVAVISGLGSFADKELLQKSLSLFLDGTLLAQDMWTLIGPTFDREETFLVTWDWFTKNFDAIVEKVGHKAIPRLPGVGGGFCDENGKKSVSEFFADPKRQRPGTERNLANTLESIDQCIRRRKYLEAGLASFLD